MNASRVVGDGGARVATDQPSIDATAGDDGAVQDAAGADGDGSDSDASSDVSEETQRLRDAAHLQHAAAMEKWLAAATSLTDSGYAVIDGFIGDVAAALLKQHVLSLYAEGSSELFGQGRTGGSGDGKGSKRVFSEASLRGDRIAVLPEEDFDKVPGLAGLLRRADRLMKYLASAVPELRSVTSRSQPMLACYPGNGSRYVKHVDKAAGNTRLLTCLFYLNDSWSDGDGGELRLYHADGSQTDVKPLFDRCCIFWSDDRTPHEVLPAFCERWAISVWYHAERELAGVDNDDDVEQRDGQPSMMSFGNSVEEIRAFLFALAELNDAQPQGAGASPDQPSSSKSEPQTPTS